jgi:hypothetical protein
MGCAMCWRVLRHGDEVLGQPGEAGDHVQRWSVYMARACISFGGGRGQQVRTMQAPSMVLSWVRVG